MGRLAPGRWCALTCSPAHWPHSLPQRGGAAAARARLATEARRAVPVTQRLLLVALLVNAVVRAAKIVPFQNVHYAHGDVPAIAVGAGRRDALGRAARGLFAPELHDVRDPAVQQVLTGLADLARAVCAGSEITDSTRTINTAGGGGCAGRVWRSRPAPSGAYGLRLGSPARLGQFGAGRSDALIEAGLAATPLQRRALGLGLRGCACRVTAASRGALDWIR